jgi:hypothetical protein
VYVSGCRCCTNVPLPKVYYASSNCIFPLQDLKQSYNLHRDWGVLDRLQALAITICRAEFLHIRYQNINGRLGALDRHQYLPTSIIHTEFLQTRYHNLNGRRNQFSLIARKRIGCPGSIPRRDHQHDPCRLFGHSISRFKWQTGCPGTTPVPAH